MKLGEALRRHERRFALGYLALVGGLLAVLVLPPTRRLAFRAVGKAVREWDARWERRVELGEALVKAGRYEEAASYLARLDRQFPARDVRHARDKERERLLVALGRSYAELDRRQRAIETYQQLVAFDPRNYRNSYALALAANRLLAGWAPAPEARDAFVQVLTLNPNHLPSVRGAMAYYAARGEFADVVRHFQAYLDAYLRHSITVTLGEGVSEVADLAVDGTFHELELGLSRPAGWTGDLRIATGGFGLGLERASVLTPAHVGVAESPRSVDLPWDSAAPSYMVAAGDGRWVGQSGGAGLVLPVPGQTSGIAAVRLRLRLFKPVDQSTWDMAVTAFRNRLDLAGLEAARARVLVIGSQSAADSVLLRPRWATSGLGVGADDSRLP